MNRVLIQRLEIMVGWMGEIDYVVVNRDVIQRNAMQSCCCNFYCLLAFPSSDS
jgi:hypothetical protein